MTINSLDNRLRALEDDFFRQVDLKLSEKLRENTLRAGKRERLSKLMSIHDEATLDELIDYGINEETVAAILLAPLVFVAWADGQVTDAERQTVIEIVSGYSQMISRMLPRRLSRAASRHSSSKRIGSSPAHSTEPPDPFALGMRRLLISTTCSMISPSW